LSYGGFFDGQDPGRGRTICWIHEKQMEENLLPIPDLEIVAMATVL
jgi:hypothetical protein